MKKFVSVLLIIALLMSAVVTANAAVFQVDPDPAAKENVTGAKTLISALRAMPRRSNARLKASGFSKVAIVRAAENLEYVGEFSLIVPTSFYVYAEDEEEGFVEYFSDTYDAAIRITWSDWMDPDDNVRFWENQGFTFSAEPVEAWDTDVELGMWPDETNGFYYMIGLFNAPHFSVDIKMVTDYLSPELQDMFISMLASVMAVKEEEQIPVESVTLNKTKATMFAKTTVSARQTLKLDYTLSPFNASYKVVTWSSSNEKVATVTQSGLVTAIKAGTTLIKVRAMDGSDEYATCKIVVKPAESVTLNSTSKTMFAKATVAERQKVRLKATISPSTVDSSYLTWTSSNEKVASVNQNGLVTAKTAGTAVIKAALTDGSKEYATCKITVKPAESVTLNKTAKTMYAKRTARYRQTLQLKATVTPSTVKSSVISWTSSNEKVATVDKNGLVTAIGAGVAEITVSLTDGSEEYAACTVTVKKNTTAAMTGLKASPASLSLKVGKKSTLSITTVPTSVWNDRVTWSSTNTAVATVSSTGVVTAKKAGTCYIKATSEYGKKTVKVKVTVTK